MYQCVMNPEEFRWYSDSHEGTQLTADEITLAKNARVLVLFCLRRVQLVFRQMVEVSLPRPVGIYLIRRSARWAGRQK